MIEVGRGQQCAFDGGRRRVVTAHRVQRNPKQIRLPWRLLAALQRKIRIRGTSGAGALDSGIAGTFGEL
jgi:hypothetical protein